MLDLYGFEIEREVREWLENLSASDFKRVDEVAGLLAEKGTELGGPWAQKVCERDHWRPATETYERQV